MEKGISLHVGVNEVDPGAFSATTLKGCVNDAEAMYQLAGRLGYYERKLVRDKEADYDTVVSFIKDAAPRLSRGDIFLFTFAGHGSNPDDQDEEEINGRDEAILLHNRMLLDDVMRQQLWPLFAEGVRILMVADCCHSGTLHQAPPGAPAAAETASPGSDELLRTPATALADFDCSRVRTITTLARRRHFREHRRFYRDVLTTPPAGPLRASFLLLAACAEDDITCDGPTHGTFTEALLKVWDGGKFDGDYAAFRTAIETHPNLTARSQQPQLKDAGPPLDPVFRNQKPVFALRPLP